MKIDEKKIKDRVLIELDSVKSWKKDNPIPIEESGGKIEKNFLGSMAIVLLKFTNLALKSGLQIQAIKKKYDDWEKHSDYLLKQSIVIKTLCSLINGQANTNKLSEEDIIEIVIRAFQNMNFQEKISVDKNPVLLAFIVYGLMQIGIENFCQKSMMSGDF